MTKELTDVATIEAAIDGVLSNRPEIRSKLHHDKREGAGRPK
jgi:hypothetical protein